MRLIRTPSALLAALLALVPPCILAQEPQRPDVAGSADWISSVEKRCHGALAGIGIDSAERRREIIQEMWVRLLMPRPEDALVCEPLAYLSSRPMRYFVTTVLRRSVDLARKEIRIRDTEWLAATSAAAPAGSLGELHRGIDARALRDAIGDWCLRTYRTRIDADPTSCMPCAAAIQSTLERWALPSQTRESIVSNHERCCGLTLSRVRRLERSFERFLETCPALRGYGDTELERHAAVAAALREDPLHRRAYGEMGEVTLKLLHTVVWLDDVDTPADERPGQASSSQELRRQARSALVPLIGTLLTGDTLYLLGSRCENDGSLKTALSCIQLAALDERLPSALRWDRERLAEPLRNALAPDRSAELERVSSQEEVWKQFSEGASAMRRAMAGSHGSAAGLQVQLQYVGNLIATSPLRPLTENLPIEFVRPALQAIGAGLR